MVLFPRRHMPAPTVPGLTDQLIIDEELVQVLASEPSFPCEQPVVVDVCCTTSALARPRSVASGQHQP